MKIQRYIVLLIIALPIMLCGQRPFSPSPMNNLGDIKINYQLSMGSALHSFGNQASGLSNFISPTIHFSKENNWSFYSGVTIFNHNLFDSGITEASSHIQPATSPLQNRNNHSYLFMGGTYHVNEALTIMGSSYKKINHQGGAIPMENANAFNFDEYGVNLGVQYKFGENSKIGATFIFHKNSSPYYHSPSLFGESPSHFYTPNSPFFY